MFRRFTKKRLAVVLGAIAALAVAGGAYAYLTTTGTGSGSGDVSAKTAVLGLTSSISPFDHLTQQNILTIYATNSSTSAEHVGGITVTATPQNGCPAGSFTVDATPTVDLSEVPASQSTPVAIGHVPVTFQDLPTTAQNACLATGAVSFALGSS